MCGIVGTVDLEFSPSVLEHLRHRGPDSQGVEQIHIDHHSIFLAHTRLAILDLSPAGHQPMRSRNGRWWVSFNGEIYNHLALRKEITGPFRGHSDTETLVELLEESGIEKTLPRLNGMFAFAALDTRERKLYLARDPFGIKPIYYVKRQEEFAFASEVRALRALGLDDSIDPEGLKCFLTLRYVPSPHTLWRDIRRLPPGHLLCFDLDNSTIRLSRYIEPVKERFHGSIEDAVDAYREQLSAAVRRQLLSDVPVGVLLSGGIDSALVAAMAKDNGYEPPCFTVGFGQGHRECEIDDAAHTARTLGLPFHSIEVAPDALRVALPAIVHSVEEPLGTTSIMPMWYLVRRARDDVTVVLTGQGSDEPWGGYFRYQVELVWQMMPCAQFWRMSRPLVTLWRARPEAVERGLRALAQHDVSGRILEACSLFSANERRLLLGDDGDGGAYKAITYWLDWLNAVGPLSHVERMMCLDARMNLADDLLLYGDKISMAVALEARVPMLDIDLVRFVESLPIGYRVKWRKGKVVHKMMAESYLPPEIVHRPKKGFQVPFGDWSRGPWRAWMEERLLDGLKGLLRHDSVEQLWREHLAGRPNRSRQMFALLMLALWLEGNR